MDRRRITEYIYSLPERLVRSASALAGGAAFEIGAIALPARVRRSRLYDTLVHSTVRFLVQTVGQVEMADGERPPDDFLVRRAAGNVVEIAGVAAFRASPVWVLAALADIAGASRELMRQIAGALQEEGLLEKDAKFEHADELLDGLERTSARLAETVNTPPLNVAALREELRVLREDAASIPRAVLPSVEKVWAELKSEARAQNRSIVEISSVMALATVRQLPERTRWLSSAVRAGGVRTGVVLTRGLLDHYSSTLLGIHRAGYWRYFVREFQPYLSGAAQQFSAERISTTEKLLRRIGRADG